MRIAMNLVAMTLIAVAVLAMGMCIAVAIDPAPVGGGAAVTEDDPRLDCAAMGNRICGEG